MAEPLSPSVEELFAFAGLNLDDVQRLNRFKQENGHVFLHGSGLTGELSPTSDLDFSIVMDSLPDYLSERYGINGDRVDYTSIVEHAQNGRKLSLHISKPEFREHYGRMPVGVEFRPEANLKPNGGRSKYELVGLGEDGLYAIDLLCPQTKIDGVGVFNLTPQTGFFDFDGDRAYGYVPATDQYIAEPYDIGRVWHIDEATGILHPSDAKLNQRVLMWGLEATKAMSDTPVFPSDSNGSYDKYVSPVIRNSIAMAEEQLGYDPTDVLLTMMIGHATYRNQVAGRNKASIDYVRGQRDKIGRYISGAPI